MTELYNNAINENLLNEEWLLTNTAALDPEDWDDASSNVTLSPDTIVILAQHLNLSKVAEKNKIPESVLRIYADKLDWSIICADQPLREGFIEEFTDKVDWQCISEISQLSESFMERHADKLDWDMIAIYQAFSEDFYLKHQAKLAVENILSNKRLLWLDKNRSAELKTKKLQISK